MEPKTNTTHEGAILKLIKDKKLMRFDHIWGHYGGCSRSTGYEHGLDKSDAIKEALSQNRVKATDYLLQKWISGDNPTLQISAMRMVCSSDEHRLLNQSYVDHQNDGGKFESKKHDLTKLTDQELIAYARIQAKIEGDSV
jgi:hypothetical protein